MDSKTTYSSSGSSYVSSSLFHPRFVYDDDVDDDSVFEDEEEEAEDSFEMFSDYYEATRSKSSATARLSRLLWAQCGGGIGSMIHMDDEEDDEEDADALPPPKTTREWLAFLTSKLEGFVQDRFKKTKDESSWSTSSASFATAPFGYPTDDSSSDSDDNNSRSSSSSNRRSTTTATATATATRRPRSQSEAKTKSSSSRRRTSSSSEQKPSRLTRRCIPRDSLPLSRPTRRALA
jgi:hypothetical protein